MIRGAVFFACILVLTVGLSGGVHAGVGLVFEQQNVLVSEGERVCVFYRIWNPSADDAFMEVAVSGEIAELFISTESETKLVAGNTGPAQAVPVQFCFVVPDDVYANDRSCQQPEKIFSGSIVVQEVSDASGGGSGSIVSGAAAAPVNIRVTCSVPESDFNVIYLLAVLLLVIVVVFVILLIVHRDKLKRVRRRPSGGVRLLPGSDRENKEKIRRIHTDDLMRKR